MVDTYESDGQWEPMARLVRPRRQNVLVSICRQLPMFVGENIDRAARLFGHVDLYRIYVGDGSAATDLILEDWDVLRKAKQAGKVRAIGISTHSEHMLTSALAELEGLDYVMFPYNFIHARADYSEFLPAAIKKGVGLVAIKPLAAGSIVKLDPRARAGSWPENERVALYQARDRPLLPAVVAQLTKGLGRQPDESLCQAALRFVYSRPFITCAMPGMFQDHELEENYQALTRYLKNGLAEAGPLDAARRLAELRGPDWLPHHYRWLDQQWRALIFTSLVVAVWFSVIAFPPARDARTDGVNGPPPTLGPTNAQPAKDEAATNPEFKAAGVCARCHVVSVLEWGISKHVASGTTCRDCHGQSRAHVANERNEVKPDTLPRGDQIARTCQRCHDTGCPETFEMITCQKCHHVHALLDPNRRPRADDAQLGHLHLRWEAFRQHMDEGEGRVRRRDWNGARKSFQDALALRPGDRDATSRLTLCKRRLDPVFPGFTVVGDAFDSTTGLPREVKVTGLDIPMVLIPAGEFDLGDDHLAGSRPVHTVAVAACYLGKCEVTQAQWQALMASNPSVHQGKAFAEAGRMPVEFVSWNDCQEFIKRLNEQVAGGGFRLPTEAEWEYACRAGSSDPRPIAPVGQSAWFRENARRDPSGNGSSQSPDAWSPGPVGTKNANPWGLHDMQGNVSEWCSTIYRPYPYDRGDRRESLDAPGMRVLRGGGFADSAEGLDPALRHYDRPHRRYRWDGLRLARDVPP